MKKQLTALLLTFALLLTMAGCSAAHAVQKLDRAEDKVEAKLDAIEDQVESTIKGAVSPSPASAPTLPSPVPGPTSAAPVEPPHTPTDNPLKLTEEQAKQIALEYLSLTANQVTRLRCKYEIDDGIPQYDVEFLQEDWEYEFEIHGETGQILSCDKDHKYD